MPGFYPYMSYGVSNSGPHACKASSLPIEPSSWIYILGVGKAFHMYETLPIPYQDRITFKSTFCRDKVYVDQASLELVEIWCFSVPTSGIMDVSHHAHFSETMFFYIYKYERERQPWLQVGRIMCRERPF